MLGADKPLERPDISNNAFADYLAYVRAIMYTAWRQPPALSGVSGLVTVAQIRIQRDGRIAQREIVRSAGNELMDASVMAALEAVEQLRPLPPERGDHEDITIDFELTRP